jgi:hypothetical protein
MRLALTSPRSVRILPAALALVLLSPATLAWSQGSQPTNAIYTCVDDKGRRVNSDRPIAECMHKEQLMLNRDGSLRMVIPPSLTADERAEREARERRAAEQRTAQQEALRRDRNLAQRYPNEAAHRKAREGAVDTVRLAIKNSEARLAELTRERKPLLSEAEFYAGKALPAKLKQQLDANDAALEAQRTLAANQTAELDRINALYDAELERLRRLWAGAPPGSLGTLPAPARGARHAGPTTPAASR